jgi:glyoxylase-like metal-dependent hydrolase (beta-lactamase superfamily II)
MSDAPRQRSATYAVLTAGYADGPRGGVASTVGYVRDGETTVVVDPGMVRDRGLILDPLQANGVTPDDVTDVTDVIFSHHHPDHTLNAALFLRARFHDHWAIYHDDTWHSRDADGVELTPSVRLIHTPGGHSHEDVTTLVGTPEGVVAFTHLWWHSEGPAEDPYSPDPTTLHAARERVLAVADLIVPGHGPAFTPDSTTPR